jgi:hypothetical protein
VDKTFPQIKIPGEIYSGDLAKRARFDASRWFATATTEELATLARSGWHADRLAHDIAAESASSDDAVADVLQYVMYLRHGGLQGMLRCCVDSEVAAEWLAYFRPAAAAAVGLARHTLSIAIL